LSKIFIEIGETASGAKAKLDLQELTTGRTFLCSVSRYGKTWTARRIIEQIFGQVGIIIIDVEGEYATLRDKFPLLIIGQDVPLVPESAEFLADQILEHDLSAIIDGSNPELDAAAFQEFLARFVTRFIAIETQARKPYLFVLEEADELAPEKGITPSLCKNEIMRLVKKGGKRGLGVLVLTQRAAFVSKFVISQCVNKLIGRNEWPDDLEVLRKFARIPAKYADPESKNPDALKNFRKGQFFVAGDFVGKSEIVQVGPVITKHLGATPSVVPPAPKELEEILQQLKDRLPAIIQEKIAPSIPKVAEIEARIRDKFEAQWGIRLARKDKELASIRNKLEARYETRIADLERKLADAIRQVTIQGPVTDLLKHPLVQQRLADLNPRQRGLIELLETKGPQDPEHLSLFLGVPPKRIPQAIYEVNRVIPKVIENVGGRYESRLIQLFPVTEEAQAHIKEIRDLQAMILKLQASLDTREGTIQSLRSDVKELTDYSNAREAEATALRKELNDLREKGAVPQEGMVDHRAILGPEDLGARDTMRVMGKPEPIPLGLGGSEPIEVHATLVRTLASFQVIENKTVFVADEAASISGKLLTRGLKGFFGAPQKFGDIMNELERIYGTSKTNTKTRGDVQDALMELCAAGVLDRVLDGNQWAYSVTAEFQERVKSK